MQRPQALTKCAGPTFRSSLLAFADPQSVTVNAVANTLPRVNTGQNSSSYSKDDGSLRLQISHAYGKRTRRTVRLDHSKISPDPLQPSTNSRYTMSTYVVMDVPAVGYSAAEIKQVVDALTGYLTASSGSAVTKVLGGES